MVFMIPVYVVGCILLLIKVATATVDDTGLCAIIAATNIQTVYSEWNCLSGGQVSTDPCVPTAWRGITYCNTNGPNWIYFDNLGLTGTIPSAVAAMTKLTQLSFTGNKLTGTIPTQIASMTQLQAFYADQNSLQGQIPTQLCSFPTDIFRFAGNTNQVTPLCYPACYPPKNTNGVNACPTPTVSPSVKPTAVPSTLKPTTYAPTTSIHPTVVPTIAPSTALPTIAPSTAMPTVKPSSAMPTVSPSTAVPTIAPSTALPTIAPSTAMPTIKPSTAVPTLAPSTALPTDSPSTAVPTDAPSTAGPTRTPTTTKPTTSPSTSLPTAAPTVTPTMTPTQTPSTLVPTTVAPSVTPTQAPTTTLPTTQVPTTTVPTVTPTQVPTTTVPTVTPTQVPTTTVPTVSPTQVPTTTVPTVSPTQAPTTTVPTVSPTQAPTTLAPSVAPTQAPTTVVPSPLPTQAPSTALPTTAPTQVPTTVAPTQAPTTSKPTTLVPTVTPTQVPLTQAPSVVPTVGPTTSAPTAVPTTVTPSTAAPTLATTVGPTTSSPSTALPSNGPTIAPTRIPTHLPSQTPSMGPTVVPSTAQPTLGPSAGPTTTTPTAAPTVVPSTAQPTLAPSAVPTTTTPTAAPTVVPSTAQPTLGPSAEPSTITPTVVPTASPSIAPTVVASTIVPSFVPSVVPSTTAPTATPSSTAPSTVAPTLATTSNPSTAVPSNGPTIVPSTVQATLAPTEWPTTAVPSTATPSLLLTVVPSSEQPTIAPTELPTQTPSLLPTVVPSTIEPTALPTIKLSTIAPSMEPSILPTGLSTVGHSDQPTSSSPTDSPSLNAIVLPSETPTLQIATVAPSDGLVSISLPTVAPSSDIQQLTTVMPSDVPTVTPTEIPTMVATDDPLQSSSVLPTANPSDAPTTFSPTKSPTCSPSVFPTLIGATANPTVASTQVPSTAVPSQGPTKFPSSQPSSKPTTAVLPFEINQISVDESSKSKTNSTVTVLLKRTQAHWVAEFAAVMVYCGAFISATPTYNGIRTQNQWNVLTMAADEVESSVAVTIKSLQPATNYRAACYAVAASRESLRSDIVLAMSDITTKCCKGLAIALKQATISAGSAVLSGLTLQMDSLPLSAMSISLSSSNPAHIQFNPSSFSITNTSLVTSFSSDLIASTAGNAQYTITATVSGPSAAEYGTTSYSTTITVIPIGSVPAAPSMQKAQFSNDGTYVTVSFDSKTNMADIASINNFPCASLLTFTGSSIAMCKWSDEATVLIYPSSDGSITAGSTISLASNVHLKGYCTSAISSRCNERVDASTSQVVSVDYPANPILPTVVIRAPSVLSPCTPLTLDISASGGSAGRSWVHKPSFIVSAVSSPSALNDNNPMNISVSTKLISDFLNNHYTITPPSSINASWLLPGYHYAITLTLCNFLSPTCGISSASVSILDSTAGYVPTVTIPGSSDRDVYPSSSISLSSQAYISKCDETSSSKGLVYAWKVYRVDNTGNTLLAQSSESKDTSKFLLSASKLSVLKRYLVELTVSSGSVSSSASVAVNVQHDALVASIAGAATITVRLGDSATLLDGSSSYDKDIGADTSGSSQLPSIDFSWKCVQLLPTYQTNCPIEYVASNGRSDMRLVSAGTAEALNTTSRLTLVMKDKVASSDGKVRTSEAEVLVNVKDGNAPVISVAKDSSMVSLGNVINAAQKVKLTGQVSSRVACNAVWSVDDSSILLDKVALTPVSINVPASTAGSTSLNLVLPGGILNGGTKYAFFLSCRGTSSSVTIETNRPPAPGRFAISPTVGSEIQTKFQLIASQWVTNNLPLTYVFGYNNKLSTLALTDMQIAQARSEQSFSSLTLPAGLDSKNYTFACAVLVYDTLDSMTMSTNSVRVNPLPAADSRNAILATLSQGSGTDISLSVNDRKQVISMASAVLNSVTCNSAPNCTTLNRSPCSGTSNTCGGCWKDYIGDSGDANTLCVTSASLASSNNNNGGHCSNSNDCGVWETCVDGKCKKSPKTCRQNCWNQGDCVAVDTISGARVTNCTVGMVTCEMQCICHDDYFGETCHTTGADMKKNQEARELLLTNLVAVASAEDVSPQAVTSWVASLTAIAQNPHDISDSAASTVLTVANVILEGAASVKLSYEDTQNVLNAIDTSAVAGTIAKANRRRRRLASDDTTSQLHNRTSQLLDKFVGLTAKDMVPGQSSVESVQASFRVGVHPVESTGDSTVNAPMTSNEKASGLRASSINIGNNNNGGSIVLGLVTTKANQYDTDLAGNLNSNPLRVQILSDDDLDMDYMIIQYTLQLTAAQQYGLKPYTNVSFTTNCTYGKESMRSYVCPDEEPFVSGVTILHKCNHTAPNTAAIGTNYTITSLCPVKAFYPVCNTIQPGSNAGAHNTDCTVLSYTSTNVTCLCPARSLIATSSSHDRRLSVGDTVQNTEGLSEVVAMSTFVGVSFGDTLSSADSIDSFSDLQHVLIVIVMFSVLWAFGLTYLFVFTVYKENTKAKVALTLSKKLEESKQAGERSLSSVSKMEDNLVHYINQIFPSVFMKKSALENIYTEMSKHHSYITIFTAPRGEKEDRKRLLAGMKMLTVQTMLMFMLAVCYDLQGPSDDGSCVEHMTEKACLQRRSIYDTSVTYCVWQQDTSSNGDFTCVYREIPFTWIMVLFATIVVAMCTAIFNVPIDLIFDALKAPTAGTASKTASLPKTGPSQVSMARRVGRRMSNIAKHASDTTNELFSLAMNRYNRAIAGSEVRDIPDSALQAYQVVSSSVDMVAQSADELRAERLSRKTVALQGIQRKRQHMIAREDSDEEDDHMRRPSHALSRGNSSGNGRTGSKSDSKSHRDDDNDSMSSHSEDSNDNGDHELGVGSGNSSRRPSPHNNSVTIAVHDKFEDLNKEINEQRRLLKYEDTEEFDLQWGIDPMGEYMTVDSLPRIKFSTLLYECLFGRRTNTVEAAENAEGHNGGNRIARFHWKTAEDVIRSEIALVDKIANKEAAKLQLASQTDTGLEILHLFVLDILGRDTAAARIFAAKSEEDFSHAKVLTYSVKAVLWILVALLNLFFVYFSVLRGYQRGVGWQRSYMTSCIIQFFVEIFLMETSECLWIQYGVPSLITKDVERASQNVKHIIHRLCQNYEARLHSQRTKDLEAQVSMTDEPVAVLNLTPYLYISTKVAEKYPRSIESQIVLSYTTYMPGELARKWSRPYATRLLKDEPIYSGVLGFGYGSTTSQVLNYIFYYFHVMTRFLLTLSIMEALKMFGSTPLHFQKVVIHLAQPLLLTVIVFIGYMIIRNPWYTLAAVGILVVLAALEYRRRHPGLGYDIDSIRKRYLSSGLADSHAMRSSNTADAVLVSKLSKAVARTVSKQSSKDSSEEGNALQGSTAAFLLGATNNMSVAKSVDKQPNNNRKSLTSTAAQDSLKERSDNGCHDDSDSSDSSRSGIRKAEHVQQIITAALTNQQMEELESSEEDSSNVTGEQNLRRETDDISILSVSSSDSSYGVNYREPSAATINSNEPSSDSDDNSRVCTSAGNVASNSSGSHNASHRSKVLINKFKTKENDDNSSVSSSIRSFASYSDNQSEAGSQGSSRDSSDV